MSRSTKSLFRAMRPKRAEDANQAMLLDAPKQKPPRKDIRRKHDAYLTGEPDAIRALLARDGDRIRACGSVWEPACGEGHMVREIRAAGIPCTASDLINSGCPDSWTADYFTCLRSRARAIITNPPFGLITARDGKGRWLSHTLAMPDWEYLALLLSWDWPAAIANGHGQMLDDSPFTRCYLIRWKIDFTGEGSPPQRNAWFIWDRADPRGYGPGQTEPSFRFLDRVDHRQAGLFDVEDAR